MDNCPSYILALSNILEHFLGLLHVSAEQCLALRFLLILLGEIEINLNMEIFSVFRDQHNHAVHRGDLRVGGQLHQRIPGHHLRRRRSTGESVKSDALIISTNRP